MKQNRLIKMLLLRGVNALRKLTAVSLVYTSYAYCEAECFFNTRRPLSRLLVINAL